MRGRIFAAAAAVALTCAAAARAAPGAAPAASAIALRAVRTEILQSQEQEQAGNNAQAAAVLVSATDSPAFPALEPEERYMALSMLAWARAGAGDFAGSEAALKRVIALDGSGWQPWLTLLNVSRQARDRDTAVTALKTLADRWPGSLVQVPDEMVALTLNDARELKDAETRTAELVASLRAAGWRPLNPFNDLSGFYLSYAADLIKAGKLEQARAVAKGITGPYNFVAIRADRRFDPLVAADPGAFDVAKEAEADLARQRTLSAAWPGRLEGVNSVASALLGLRRPQEALALIDAAIARARSPDGGGFTDGANQIGWSMELRKTALLRLGRTEEGVAQARESAGQLERGRPNVSHRLNFADLLVSVGRPKEALQVLDAMKDLSTSAYGETVRRSAEACASAELKDQAGLTAGLQYLRAHAADGRGPLLQALLCAGKLDEAADIELAMLDNPTQRTDVLVAVQTFDQPPPLSDWDGEIHRRERAVYALPKVKAAIERCGRVERYDELERPD
jgi:tetratricopeptide (TPR) repeat protein